MYVSRPRSLYRNVPAAVSARPPEVPRSAYLVITDEESEKRDTFCWGICKKSRVSKLPFPTDRMLKVVPPSEYDETAAVKVWFVPVLDQPLSSNRYYVIKAKGKFKGKAYTCSAEDDIGACCFSNVIIDQNPRPFNHKDIYQQIEIHAYYDGSFYAESVAHDGVPPKFLRTKGWQLFTTGSLPKPLLRNAEGLNSSTRRSKLPELNPPVLPNGRSPAVYVGKWYCPFVFVKEKCMGKDRTKRSMFYEMRLERWWEEIYSCENEGNNGNSVTVKANVKKEVVLVNGVEGEQEERDGDDGFMWFRANERFRVTGGRRRRRRRRRGGVGVGLSLAIVEKMRWVVEREGWGGGERVERVEELRGDEGDEWKWFGCYVLVESFGLRRMDGSLVIRFNFKDTHRVQCKWG